MKKTFYIIASFVALGFGVALLLNHVSMIGAISIFGLDEIVTIIVISMIGAFCLIGGGVFGVFAIKKYRNFQGIISTIAFAAAAIIAVISVVMFDAISVSSVWDISAIIVSAAVTAISLVFAIKNRNAA